VRKRSYSNAFDDDDDDEPWLLLCARCSFAVTYLLTTVSAGGHFTWIPGQAVSRSVRCRMSQLFSELWNKGGNSHFLTCISLCFEKRLKTFLFSKHYVDIE